MRFRNSCFFAACLLVLVSACQSPNQRFFSGMIRSENQRLELEGSPYRREIRNVGGGSAIAYPVLIGKPGSTLASAALKREILAAIGAKEASAGGSAMPELLETRLVSNAPSGVLEVWVVKRVGNNVAYKVDISPSAQGESGFAINGPW